MMYPISYTINPVACFKSLFNPESKDIPAEDKHHFRNFYQLRKAYKKQKYGFFSAFENFASGDIVSFVNDYFQKTNPIPIPIFNRLHYFFSKILTERPHWIQQLDPKVSYQLRLHEFFHVKNVIKTVRYGFQHHDINKVFNHRQFGFPHHDILNHLIDLMCSLSRSQAQALFDEILDPRKIRDGIIPTSYETSRIVILGKFVQQSPQISCIPIFESLLESIKQPHPITQGAALFSLTLFALSEVADEKQKATVNQLIEKAMPSQLARACQVKIEMHQALKAARHKGFDTDHRLQISRKYSIKIADLLGFSDIHSLSESRYTQYNRSLPYNFCLGVCIEFASIPVPTINLVTALHFILVGSIQDLGQKVVAQAYQQQDLDEIYKTLKQNLSEDKIINFLQSLSSERFNYSKEINVRLTLAELVKELNDYQQKNRQEEIRNILQSTFITRDTAGIVVSYRP